jgi:phosphatidylserine/phosphatidylglycerophosphate/cardiolipin synthase-like enzyme
MARSFDQMWRRVRSATAAAPAPELVTDDATPFVAPATHDGIAAPALVGLLDGDPWRFRTARAFHFQTLIARRTLWIADAYFMPSLAEVEALEGAARDGVDVRLLVPSRNDHRWMLTLTRRYYRRLLSGGVRVWEWSGPMMHAKTTVSDGHLTRVGSTDFNPLGLALNYELDAVIEDAGLGAAAEAMFLDDLAQSREIRRADRAHEEDRAAATPARSA